MPEIFDNVKHHFVALMVPFFCNFSMELWTTVLKLPNLVWHYNLYLSIFKFKSTLLTSC